MGGLAFSRLRWGRRASRRLAPSPRPPRPCPPAPLPSFFWAHRISHVSALGSCQLQRGAHTSELHEGRCGCWRRKLAPSCPGRHPCILGSVCCSLLALRARHESQRQHARAGAGLVGLRPLQQRRRGRRRRRRPQRRPQRRLPAAGGAPGAQRQRRQRRTRRGRPGGERRRRRRLRRCVQESAAPATLHTRLGLASPIPLISCPSAAGGEEEEAELDARFVEQAAHLAAVPGGPATAASLLGGCTPPACACVAGS